MSHVPSWPDSTNLSAKRSEALLDGVTSNNLKCTDEVGNRITGSSRPMKGMMKVKYGDVRNNLDGASIQGETQERALQVRKVVGSLEHMMKGQTLSMVI